MNTRRGPKRATMYGKATNCKMLFRNPNSAIHKPTDAGLIPSPPNSTDVDQASGIRASVIISNRAIMQKFATDTTTGLVSRARNGTGFSVSFVGPSNISPAPTQGRSDLAPVLGFVTGLMFTV